MRMISPFLGAAMVLLLAASLPAPSPGEELTVLYTANSSGKLQACSCPHDPYGGLAERITLISRLRKESGDFLLVDGGNMVSLFGAFDSKAACVMKLMNLAGYDAAGAGCEELFRGVGSACAMAEEADFPLLSATIARASNSTLVFEPGIVADVGDLSVGIISVNDATSLVRIGNREPQGYVFLPLTVMLEKTIKDLSPRCDFIILLSHLALAENEKLVGLPEIDLIVEVFGSKKYDQPKQYPGGVIVSPGRGGQFVGKLVLEKSESGSMAVRHHEFLPVLNYPEDERAHRIIMEYLGSAR